MTLTKITVHDFNGISARDVYDQTQTDDAIKDGDVLNLGGGNVAILMNAWPTIVVGEIEHFHRLTSDVTFETIDGGKYAASAAKAREVTKTMDPIGTQRVANSPLMELEYRGEKVALPQPTLAVGTVVCTKINQATNNSSYFVKKIRSQIEADTLEVVNDLRRKHPSLIMGEVGDPLPVFNAAQVDAKMAIVLAPDSVEIAGHAPRAMHAVGVIGNQCYLEDGQCHSGLKYDAYLLFRKKVDGIMLVYVHPYAVIPEYFLGVAQVHADNWWGVNEAIECEKDCEMWTRASAHEFIGQVRSIFEGVGLQLSIVGSVDTQGASTKDLDLLVQPMEGFKPTLESALKSICEKFLPIHTVDDAKSLNPVPTYQPEEQTFVNLGLIDGRTIELYFPERLFPFEADLQTQAVTVQ